MTPRPLMNALNVVTCNCSNGVRMPLIRVLPNLMAIVDRPQAQLNGGQPLFGMWNRIGQTTIGLVGGVWAVGLGILLGGLPSLASAATSTPLATGHSTLSQGHSGVALASSAPSVLASSERQEPGESSAHCSVVDEVYGNWSSLEEGAPAKTLQWSRGPHKKEPQAGENSGGIVKLRALPAGRVRLADSQNAELCQLSELKGVNGALPREFHIEYVTSENLILRDESGNSVVYDRDPMAASSASSLSK